MCFKYQKSKFTQAHGFDLGSFFGTLSLRPTLEDDHNTSYGYIVNRTIPLLKMDFMDVFPST